ncbi:amidase signature domain-containing protein [Nemania abortiva]|nr:amidase signature domain-containing protein [Nemania abortiva]
MPPKSPEGVGHTHPVDVLTTTAQELQSFLEDGSLTSVEIVKIYLDQIDRHNRRGAKLNAMISIAPYEKLMARATKLDKERSDGCLRGPLHGIPLLVKDNIMTNSSLGMDTTCGSFALKDVKVTSNADVVNYVIEAGMIILGKSNLSGWAGKKGYPIPGGWSAVGGQTQSPYIRGGFVKSDTFLGHTNPCSSSSGSAAGVAAGFAPLSLGTETDGSIIQPAGRNSVYGLKVTVGAVSTSGTSPYSPFTDSLGPIARSVPDLASLLGILMKKDFSTSLTGTWKGQTVAFVDPYLWEAPKAAVKPDHDLIDYQRLKYLEAANLIEAGGGKVARDAVMIQYEELEIEGKEGIDKVWDHDFAAGLEGFLRGYQDSPIKNLEDLVRFNEEHADLELPKEFPNGQAQLKDALDDGGISNEAYEEAKLFLRNKAKIEGFDKVFSEHGVDLLVMPQDCRICTIAAAAGYPIGIVPLGYAPFNGRGFGLIVVAGAGKEDKILSFMSAWEASHPELPKPPSQLVKNTSAIDASVALATQSRHLSVADVWQDEPGVFPLHLLPESHTALFMGRNDILSDMDSYFEASAHSNKDLSVYVIHGVGGLGKTEIAREFAHRKKKEIDAILWVGAESQASLATGFTRIATALCLPGADLKANPAQNLVLVQQWFRASSRKWLLVLDNVESYADIERYMPTGSRGSVIITTRYILQARLFGHRRMVLDSLDSVTAENLFLQLLSSRGSEGQINSAPNIQQFPETEREAIRFLLSEMGGLALGIHQLVAIIVSQNLHANVAEFAKRYKRDLPTLLQKEGVIKGHTLSTLWKVSFRSVQANKPALLLLGILCCVSPDDIPKDLLFPSNSSGLVGDLEIFKDESELDEAISFLVSLGLIDTNGQYMSLHRLVQLAFMMQLSPEERQMVIDAASKLLRLAFPVKTNAHLFLSWPQCQKFFQHVTSLAWWLERLTKANLRVSPPAAFISCISDCAWYLIETGNAKEACGVLEATINADGSKFDVDGSHLLNALGMAYFDLASLPKCRENLLKSQKLREELLPATSVYLASIYQNIGNIDNAEGYYDRAIISYDKTLKILKSHDADFPAPASASANELSLEERNHVHTTGIVHLNKGRAYIGAKMYADAISSLDIYQEFAKRAGCELIIGFTYHYLHGNIHLGTGDYTAAMLRYQEALNQVTQRCPGHAIEASIYFKMGTAQFRVGNFEAAMEFCSRGLQKAKLRGDCLGHQARILRRQAQIIKCAQQGEEGKKTTWLDSFKSVDPDHLLLRANNIRLQMEGSAYRAWETEEGEEESYDRLVGPFIK